MEKSLSFLKIWFWISVPLLIAILVEPLHSSITLALMLVSSSMEHMLLTRTATLWEVNQIDTLIRTRLVKLR